eukprot:jgi/Hompol1/1445/HPOL_001141-RA
MVVHLLSKATALLLLLVGAAAQGVPTTNQQPQPIPPHFSTGDCVSGRLYFANNNTYLLNGADQQRFDIDRTLYNWTLDYGTADFAGGAATIYLMRNPNNVAATGLSTRLSTTRYIRYGRMTARFKRVANQSNELTQDEIDYEILGKDAAHPQHNLFTYKAVNLERGLHGGPITTAIDTSVAHDYTIDWRSDRIDWIIDGAVVFSQPRATSHAVNAASLPSGDPWFPESASRIQISVWDATSQASWAGSPINYGSSDRLAVMFEYLDITCYDNNNTPVPRFSTDGSNKPTIEDPIPAPTLPTLNPSPTGLGSSAMTSLSAAALLLSSCLAVLSATILL